MLRTEDRGERGSSGNGDGCLVEIGVVDAAGRDSTDPVPRKGESNEDNDAPEDLVGDAEREPLVG